MSELLNRVKNFLPAMKSANEELNRRLEQEGNLKSVQIDTELNIPEDENSDDSDEEIDLVKNKMDKDILDESNSDKRTVNLEFALGEFDDPEATFDDNENDKTNIIGDDDIDDNNNNVKKATSSKPSGLDSPEAVLKARKLIDDTNNEGETIDIGLTERSTRKK